MNPEFALTKLSPKTVNMQGEIGAVSVFIDQEFTPQDIAASVAAIPTKAGQSLILWKYGGQEGELSLARLHLLHEVIKQRAGPECWQDLPGHRKGLIGDMISVDLMLGLTPTADNYYGDNRHIAAMLSVDYADWVNVWHSRFQDVRNMINAIEGQGLSVIYFQLNGDSDEIL